MLFINVNAESEDRLRTIIRVAYPTATLINGHIGQVLLRTNILERNNLSGEVTGFQYGPPMMEALVSGKVDVAFTSEVPATLPLAQGHKAKIIATFGSLGRNAILVQGGSSIKSVKDLKGKKVGVPFGSSPHRNLLGMLKEAGLAADKDVSVLNIGRDEIASVLLKGGVDAIMIWDPALEQYVRKNNFNIVESSYFHSVVIMNTDFIQNHPEGAKNFLSALKEAVLFMATHKDEVNVWFGEVSRLDPEIINACAEFNHNYRTVKKISDVKIVPDDNFLEMMRQSAQFTFAQKMVPQLADIDKSIDSSLLKEAEKKLDDNTYNPLEVVIR